MELVLNDELRQLFMIQRKTLLEQVDALERLLNMSPRTAEIRKEARDKQVEVKLEAEKGA